jgi:hypothetical protein
MSYEATEFFPKRTPGFEFHQPRGPVQCRVVRADLVGLGAFGARGIYHSGILFSTADAEWALELTISNLASLVPRVVAGRVEVDNLVQLNYYPPLDAHLWRSYWTVTSDLVCTISPAEYAATMRHVTDRIGPEFPRYVPFQFSDKPDLALDGSTGIQTTTVQTVQNTCDKLPMRIFEYLRSAHGVEIAPFPVTRIFLQTAEPARPVAPTDPGLLAYAAEAQQLIGPLTALSNKDYMGAIKLIVGFSANPAHVGAFRYFFSLGFDPPHTQSYYVAPAHDTSISISDVYVDLGPASRYAESTGAAFAAIDDWSPVAETAGMHWAALPSPYPDLVLHNGRSNPAVGRDSQPVQRWGQ